MSKKDLNPSQMHCKSTIVLLLIVLSMSVTLVVLLSWRCISYYKKYLIQRLDPTGELFLKETSFTELQGCQNVILILGSSRAAQWNTPILAGSCFINAGIDGQTSTQVALRTNELLKSTKPHVVLLQVGTNDIKSITLFPDQRDLIISSFKKNISFIIQTCKANDAVVIISTVFPVPQIPLYRKPIWNVSSSKALVEFNQFILQLSKEENVFLLDSYNLLVDSNSNQLNKVYKKDFLHINEKGYAKLNNELSPLLTTILNNQ